MSESVPAYPAASRREMIGMFAGFAGLAAVPSLPFVMPRLSRMWHAGDERRRVLEEVARLVIPKTDTPGADETGVAEFVQLALRHGLDGTREAAGGSSIVAAGAEADDGHETHAVRRLLMPVKSALDEGAGGDFLRAPPEKRLAAVQALDAEAFKDGNDDHPWHKIKDLIVVGYYTSEPGASKELNYELVPGRWDADIPLAPDAHAYSSDWTAVEFS